MHVLTNSLFLDKMELKVGIRLEPVDYENEKFYSAISFENIVKNVIKKLLNFKA